jgi:hypothetical protein
MVAPDAEALQMGLPAPEPAASSPPRKPGHPTHRCFYGSVAIGWERHQRPAHIPGGEPVHGRRRLRPLHSPLYAALIGDVGGILIGPDLLDRVRTPQGHRLDQVLRVETAWGIGFSAPGGPI